MTEIKTVWCHRGMERYSVSLFTSNTDGIQIGPSELVLENGT